MASEERLRVTVVYVVRSFMLVKGKEEGVGWVGGVDRNVDAAGGGDNNSNNGGAGCCKVVMAG